MPQAPLCRPLLLALVCMWATVSLPHPASGQEPNAGDAAVQKDAEQNNEAAAPAARYWTTQWSFQDVDVGQVLDRLRSVGIEVPIEAGGDVSVAFTVAVPWNRLRDAAAYRFSGRLASNRLRLESLQLENFRAELDYRDGVLTLPNIQGRWVDLDQRAALPANRPSSPATAASSAGSFEGQASAALVPRGNFTAQLEAEQLSLSPLRDLFLSGSPTSELEPIGGVLTGRVKADAPLEQIRDLSRWTLQADVQLSDFRIGPSPPLEARSGPVSIENGVLKAPEVAFRFGQSESARLDLDLTAELDDDREFEFSVRGNDVPLQTLADFGFDESLAQGKVDLAATGNGTLGSSLAAARWNIEGRLGSPELVILDQNLGVLEHRFVFNAQHFELTPLEPEAAAGFEAMRLRDIRADYEITPQAFAFRSIDANLYGGNVQGEATLARQDGATHRFDLAWDGIRPVVDLRPVVGLPIEIAAATTGTIDWQVPAGKINQPASHQGTLDVSLRDVTLGGASIGQLQAQVTANAQTLNVSASGTLFGGSVSVETQTDVAADDRWESLWFSQHRGEIEIQRADAALLQRVVRPRDLRRWSGHVSGSIDLNDVASNADETGATTQPQTSFLARQIAITMEDLAIDGRRIARRLQTRVRFIDGVMVIDRASGSYAGGRLWAEGRWAVSPTATAPGVSHQIQLRISAVNADDALLTLSRDASKCASGKVSGWLTITQGEQIRVRGAISARESALFGVPTGTINSGVVARLSPDFRRWEISLPTINGELARGRIEGDAVLASSSIRPGAFDLTSRWSARKVDFGMLLSEVQTESRFAHGRLTGSLALSGRGIRDVGDLAGNFKATLEATQAGAIPGLLKADRYLGLISLGGVQFTDGTLEGIIAGGAARIDTLLLQSPRVQMFAEGRVRLADARMQLDVILSTGTYVPSERLAQFAAQLAIQSVLPVATLIEINQLLSDRTIHLAFEGPADDPRIRLKPLAIIREEVVRLLIRESLNAASANVND